MSLAVLITATLLETIQFDNADCLVSNNPLVPLEIMCALMKCDLEVFAEVVHLPLDIGADSSSICQRNL